VKAIRRGLRFDHYSAGQMKPHGFRSPSGGRPGDAYTMYNGMTAENAEGVEILFTHVEVRICVEYIGP
jgi:hypothetical protein